MPEILGARSRNYKAYFTPAQLSEQRSEHLRLAKIALDEVHARQRLHRQYVHRHHPALGPELCHRHLRPASGRRAQVDHQLAGDEQPVFLVQFQQLIGGAANDSLPPWRVAHKGR